MKNTIFGIVIGVAITVIVGLGWNLYVLNKTVKSDHALLAQVANFLNSQIQKANPQATQVTK
jgi:uncharacterized membrane protein YukC